MFLSVLKLVVGVCGAFATVEAPVEKPEYWRHASVIYAEVISVDLKSMPQIIELRPIATLTGQFDSGSSPIIRSGVSFGVFNSSSVEVPSKSAKVVALVNDHDDPGIHIRYGIPSRGVAGFPKDQSGGGTPLFEVTGFDDPKVTETIENLRKLRGAQREEAEKKSTAEKPAASPTGNSK